jgi:hypothetical protein
VDLQRVRGALLYDSSVDAANVATAIAVLLDFLAIWRAPRVPQACEAAPACAIQSDTSLREEGS